MKYPSSKLYNDESNKKFFTSICTSKTIQTSTICTLIENSTILNRLEIWRCYLGPTFGIQVAKMIRENKSLRTLVISHVGNFHASSGVVALSESLKFNTTLQNLILLNMGNKDQKSPT